MEMKAGEGELGARVECSLFTLQGERGKSKEMPWVRGMGF